MGGSFASRVCASLLLQAGLPELVTDSDAAYEAKALQLAHQQSALSALRNRLQVARENRVLFDMPQLARQLEHALLWMHKRALEYGPPAPLELTL
jgi:predicted O-linked N-acetylglucosamine transferase (SPINDLY family)